MEKKDYIKKMKELLDDTNTYRPLNTDPTMKQKNRLINILRRVKTEVKLEDTIYRIMYPAGACSPKLYGLPKIHKKNNPMRPIVSSRGSVSYVVAKESARILNPLTGRTTHDDSNSKEFAEEIKKYKLWKDECIISYDVSALFTSIPVKSALYIIKKKLEQDKELQNKTSMSINNIMLLLEFSLCNTYFLFQGQFYEQTKGAAMGSPVSLVVANLFMEEFENRALTSAVNPTGLWNGFVDDTFVILLQSQKEEFLQHINFVDPSIKFTTEELKEDGSMPFYTHW